jgi:hypothetical protein
MKTAQDPPKSTPTASDKIEGTKEGQTLFFVVS